MWIALRIARRIRQVALRAINQIKKKKSGSNRMNNFHIRILKYKDSSKPANYSNFLKISQISSLSRAS